MFRFILALSVLCQVVFSGAVILASDDITSESASESPSESNCSPKCREGFFCDNGECVSPCNPTCPSQEVCTRNGKCVPSQLPSPPPQTVSAAPPAQVQYSGNRPPPGAVGGPPARYPYSTGTGNRVAGTILLIVGMLNIATAPLCTTDMVDSSVEEGCLIGSLAFGGTLTLIGIPLLAVGNAKKRRYLEWRRLNSNSGNIQFAFTRQYGGIFWNKTF